MIHKLVKIVFGVNLLITNQIKSGLELHNFSLIEGHMDHQMPWFNCFDGQINRDCLMLGGKVSISNEDLRDLVEFGHDLHIDSVDLAIFVKDNGFQG